MRLEGRSKIPKEVQALTMKGPVPGPKLTYLLRTTTPAIDNPRVVMI